MSKLGRYCIWIVVGILCCFISKNSSADNYYWVGNSGDWTDLSHWATSSGGSTLHTTLPSTGDIVYFDNMSFNASGEIVTVDTSFISCQSIIWTGVTNDPAFVGTNFQDSLILSGDLILSSGMYYDYVGNLFFLNSSPTLQLFNSGGNPVHNNVFINTGTLRLMEEFEQLNGVVHHIDGLLELNGYGFSCRNYNLDTSNLNAISVISPSISGSDTIQCRGHFYLDPSHTLAFTGPIYFSNNKDTNYRIQFANHSLIGDLYWGTGDYTLLSTMSTAGEIIMNGGTDFSSNGNAVVCEKLEIFSSLTQNISFANSNIGISGSQMAFMVKSNNINADIFLNTSVFFTYSGQDTIQIVSLKGSNPIFIRSMHLNGSNHEFYSDATIDTVYVQAGARLMIFPGYTLELDELIANGNCGEYIYINSSCSTCLAGDPSLRTLSGPELISYVVLKDIQGFGGFTAANSYDDGSVFGFTITNPTSSTTHYWIGGQGEWTDPAHWSLTSGGTPGTCIPEPGDDVVFDINSFSANDTVFISENAYCNKMKWTGLTTNPVLFSHDKTLNIYDTLWFHNNLTLDFDGLFLFENALADTSLIYPNGVDFSNDIEFDADGLWEIAGHLNIDGNIVFTKGELDISNVKISCNNFISDKANTRILDMTNSLLQLNGSDDIWKLNTSGSFTFNHSGSKILIDSLASGNSIFNGKNLSYDTLVIANPSTTIKGNNSFTELKIMPGSSLILFANSTQSVDTMIASGDCAAPVHILCSDLAHDTAIIINTGGDSLALDHTIMNNVTVDTSGGKKYIVNNGELLNNCSGWNLLNPGSGMTYYWIGGSGNWNDPAHWSATSGGTSYGCVPGILDTVIFDANSLSAASSININRSAWCNVLNMSAIDDSLEIIMNQNIYCENDFIIDDSVRITDDSRMNSIVFIPQDTTARLLTEGVLLQTNIILAASATPGRLILIDSLNLDYLYALNIDRGEFRSMNNKMKLGTFATRTSNPRKIMLGSSKISIMHKFDIQDTNTLIFDAGMSNIHVIGHPILMKTNFNGMGETFYNVSFNTPLDTLPNFEDENFVTGSNSYHYMSILPGTHVYFENTKTQTIDSLIAIGTCADSIYLFSDSDGVQATLSTSAADSVYVQLGVVQDIAVTSGGMGHFCADNGNNSNWTFITGKITTSDFYWGLPSCFNDNSEFFNYSTVFNGDTNNLSFSWYFGDNDTSSIKNPMHLYQYSGDYDVSLVATYINGCKDSTSKTISINKPIVSISCSELDYEICEGEEVSFEAVSSQAYQSYQFYLNNTPVLADSVYVSSTLNNGDEVFAVATYNGCTKHTDTLQFTVHTRPTVNLVCDDIDQIICDGDTVVFTASGTHQYQFSINGQETGPYDTISSFSLYNISNQDTITVIGMDTLTRCDKASADTLIFTVNSLPNITITSVLPNDTICSGDTISVTAGGGSIYEFFLDGLSQGSPSVNAVYESSLINNNDLIDVEGTDANGCKAFASNPLTVTVEITPSVTFTSSDPNGIICSGENVNFLASGANEYLFMLNGSNVQGPATNSLYSSTILNDGDEVTLIGTVGNCSAMADTSYLFTVYPTVTLSPSANELCQGDTVTFTAAGDAVYQFFVNGVPAATASAINTYQTDTLNNNDVVSVVGTSPLCAPNPVSMIVHDLPVVSMTCSDPDTIVCDGETVFFTASGATLYEFFVNGISAGPQGTLNIYATDSLHNGDIVTVVGSTIFGCTDIAVDNYTFSVNPLPVVSMTQSDPDLTICDGDPVTFTASGADLYEFFIDGVSQGTPSATATFTSNSITHLSTVTVEGTSNDCSVISDSVFQYTVHPIPIVTLSLHTPITICEGDTVKVVAAGAALYEFFIDGISQGMPSGNNIYISTNIQDGETISVVGTTFNCIGITNTSHTINVLPYPNLGLTCSDPNSEICFGENVIFQATGALEYQFYVDGVPYGSQDTISIIQSNQFEDGQSITVYGYNGNCETVSDTSYTLTVHKMQLTLSNNASGNMICAGDTVTFTASGADLYEFYIDGASQGTASAQNTFEAFNLSQGQIISVEGTSNTTSCVQLAHDIILMSVYGTPVISSLDPNQFCEGDSAILLSNYQENNQWFLNNNLIPGGIYPEYIAFDEGDYTLSLQFGGNGTVKSVGYNGSGQIGDSSNFNTLIPIQALNMQQVDMISCGNEHSLALLSGGDVWSWGENNFGELGNGSYADNNYPVNVTGLSSVSKIAAGGHHSLALLSNNTVSSWGKNLHGQLGYGNTATSNFPFPVSGVSNARDIAAGESHSLILAADSTVWAFGLNNYGQLGDGSYTDQLSPVMIPGLTKIIKIATGANHSLAIDDEGAIWVWGSNIGGQLGNNSIISSNVPLKLSVGANTNFKDVDGGLEHSIALDINGYVYTWGSNTHGQTAQAYNPQLTPYVVANVSNVEEVIAGYYSSYLLRKDGTAWAFGHNNHGQLGDSTTTDSNIPVRVEELAGISSLDAGKFHLAAVLENQLLCSSAPYSITVDTIPDILIYQNGLQLSTLAGGTSYQWYLNGNPIPGANGQTYTISANGAYVVEVGFPNGCSGFSDIFLYNVGMDEFWNENNISLLPNPNKGNFVLSLNIPEYQLKEIKKIACFNMIGEKVWERSSFPEQNMLTISLDNAGQGVYHICIYTEERVVKKKFVVLR